MNMFPFAYEETFSTVSKVFEDCSPDEMHNNFASTSFELCLVDINASSYKNTSDSFLCSLMGIEPKKPIVFISSKTSNIIKLSAASYVKKNNQKECTKNVIEKNELKKPKKQEKKQPKKSCTVKKSVEQQRNDKINEITKRYINDLKNMNDQVVSAYKIYREKTKSGMECEIEKNKWTELNDKYKSMKRKSAEEVYAKVEMVNKSLGINNGVHDLHGQGIKSGNFKYMVDKIVSKISNGELPEKKAVFDIGTESDGDWHKKASEFLISYLQNQKMNYSIDENKRYVTVSVDISS